MARSALYWVYCISLLLCTFFYPSIDSINRRFKTGADLLIVGTWQDGLPCLRGDRLHVVFLDKEGKSSEFPPHTEAGWGTAAKYACRVYVRLG